MPVSLKIPDGYGGADVPFTSKLVHEVSFLEDLDSPFSKMSNAQFVLPRGANVSQKLG